MQLCSENGRLIFCPVWSKCVIALTHLGFKVEVVHIGHGEVLGLGTDGRTFYCHVISCALARRDVRYGTAKASDSRGVQRAWARLSWHSTAPTRTRAPTPTRQTRLQSYVRHTQSARISVSVSWNASFTPEFCVAGCAVSQGVCLHIHRIEELFRCWCVSWLESK